MNRAIIQLLFISMCENFVPTLYLRAIEHLRPPYSPGLSLHFICDLHLIPSTRTELDLTPWMTFAFTLWLEAERLSCLASSLDPIWWCGLAFLLSVPLSCLNDTTFFLSKGASEPDWNTFFILVPGFLLFLQTPKHAKSFKDNSVNMTAHSSYNIK